MVGLRSASRHLIAAFSLLRSPLPITFIYGAFFMSETLSSIEFTKTTSPVEVMETVAREGAAAVHDFLPFDQLRRSARALHSASWWRDATTNPGEVHREHDLTRYGFDSEYPWPVSSVTGDFAPEPIFNAAQKIHQYVGHAAGPQWKPNEIMGHRYNIGDYINGHRDYIRALGYVVVLTLEGSQDFFFERDNGEEAWVDMQPGTLTIMRGHQPGSEKPRPYHWAAPAEERRLAISLRQMRMSW